jgi:cobalt-zinc-cadmium efflux system protein
VGDGHKHFHKSERRSGKSLRGLKIALALTAGYMFVEAIGGWLANSLALLADAGHMLTDVAALSLTLAAIWFGSRPATPKKTYGYYRTEILAAFINGVALVVLSIWIIFEAVERFRYPQEIAGLQMTLIASGGLVVNIIAAYLLHSGQRHDLNLRGAWLHVMGDLLGSVAAITAGFLIVGFGWLRADAVCSILISVVIIIGAWRLIMESVNVLLEGTPRHIDLTAVEAAIRGTEGVGGVHDLHVWTISSGIDALSAHITHGDSVSHSDLLVAVRDKLHNEFGIDHLTIQMETLDNEAEAVYICETGTRCFEPVGVIVDDALRPRA